MASSLFARHGRHIALALMVAIVGWPVLAWLHPVPWTQNVVERLALPDGPALPAALEHVLMVAGLLPLAVAAYGFYEAARFFGRVERGRAFSLDAVEALRRFGLALLAAAVLIPLLRLAVVLGEGTADPMAVLAAVLRLGPIVLAGIAGVVLAFSAILREAVTLAEENASFV
ncbi:DUF2975 domain-containing protein [Xanthobacter sp. KR7-65]|uniref:DUF2975 domain-containing protein n=1 Tax=Xanthobacter sp. KR7-65 TaxID=3156612 RepID=UPI0032B41349